MARGAPPLRIALRRRADRCRPDPVVPQPSQEVTRLDPPLLSSVPGQRGPAALGRHRLQPRQSPASAGPAARHPKLVPDEPPATALQDRRAAHPTCSVLRPPAGRKLLDAQPLSADSRAHRAARLAPHVIERTAQVESKIAAGGSVPAEVVMGGKPWENAGSATPAPRERAGSPDANGQNLLVEPHVARSAA